MMFFRVWMIYQSFRGIHSAIYVVLGELKVLRELVDSYESASALAFKA